MHFLDVGSIETRHGKQVVRRSFPVRATVVAPRAFATASARTTFSDFPLVVSPIATSPG
jgi:hypothetical protein